MINVCVCVAVGQGKVSAQSFSDVVLTYSCSQGWRKEAGGMEERGGGDGERGEKANKTRKADENKKKEMIETRKKNLQTKLNS